MAWEYVSDPTDYWTGVDYTAPYIADYLGYGYVDDGYVEDELWDGAANPSGTWTLA